MRKQTVVAAERHAVVCRTHALNHSLAIRRRMPARRGSVISIRQMDWSDQKSPNVDLTTELSPSRHESADHTVQRTKLGLLGTPRTTIRQCEESFEHTGTERPVGCFADGRMPFSSGDRTSAKHAHCHPLIRSPRDGLGRMSCNQLMHVRLHRG